jgi:hypothetical protein
MDDDSPRETLLQLEDKQSAKRRSAAKKLRKRPDEKALTALILALEKEILDRRTWETQYQMIMALAACNGVAGSDLLQKILSSDLEPMVHLAAGDAVVRLSADVDSAISDALNSNSFMRIDGAFRALAMMQSVPSRATINAIVTYASSPPPPNFQFRFWVAAAAAGWRNESVRSFLEACLLDPSADTRRAAEASLQNRYLKWNPL